MSRDRSDKEKNIDDVLLSIDSLLDTATDIELEDTNEIQNDSEPKLTPAMKVGNTTVTPKKPLKSSPRSKSTAKPQQKLPVRTRKTSTTSNQFSSREKTEKLDDAAPEETSQIENPSPETVTAQVDVTDNNKKPTVRENEVVLEPNQSDSGNKDQPTTKKHDESSDDNSDSLVFTTVDDDISDVMRELPVLDDIVSAEDLALIGSGKEPPKKILTEAFKRLSLTDKLIEILENQLSDYNISKLEYKYLHELFDELLDKENNKE